MKKILFLLLTGSLCVAVKSQTYTQPTVGMQSTYEGACMVNTASGTSYDNGGAGGNYAANINAVYRTFCPSVAGMMVRLTFTSFSMNDTYFLCTGPNSCCDYLTIYNGPNTSSPVLYSNCTTSPGTVTASNPTGCLTVVQSTDGSVQLGGWAATISNVAGPGGPSGTLNNDCSRATPVCNGPIVFAGSSVGPGLVSETCSGCALSEQYSMWYKIGIATSGTLAFTLNPNNDGNDYDFALYGPNVTCGALGTPIRCTKAAGAGNGNTGMGNGAVDLSETIAGDQWVSELSVTAGETYYVMINQKDDSYSGFNLNWTGTAVLSNITVASTSQTNVTCFGGSNGTASIAAPTGGSTPYTYDWAPGTPTGDGTTSVSGLTAGSWTCTVTDATGCTNVQVFSIAQPPTPVTVSALSQTNVSCFGGSNGAAAINTPTGGAGGYTYNWTPGNPTGDGTTSVTGLTAQNYTCTVTDASGCAATQTFNLTAPSAIAVTPNTQTNISCNGGSNGAAAINTPTGGAGGYTYNWTPGNPTGDGTISVTGLTAQVYTCTITDANSCVATQTFNLTAPSAIVVTASSQTNISCNGGSNGAASINTPTGGAGGYTYNWTPGNPTGDGTVGVTGLTAGTWSCTVTDANSCQTTRTFSITQPTPLVATTIPSNVSCLGGNNGTIDLTPSGSVPGYTYIWSTGNTTQDLSGRVAGVYTCTVTCSNGCTTTVTQNISQPSALAITSASQTNISCNGNSNGAASVNAATGGTGPYTYNWTPGNPTGDGTVSVTGLTSGTWTCTVTDANSCTTTQTFNITAPSALVASAASQTNISCNGGSNGAASVTVSGATPAYSYNWTPGNPTGDGTASVTGLTAGTWTCTVTDANTCLTTQTFNITAPSALVATSSAGSILCNGGTATVTVVGTGGTSPYTGTGAFTVIGGTYTYVVTDANGCTNSTSITVTQPTAVAAVATATSIACNGGNATVTVVGSGGTAPYSGEGSFTVTAGTYSYTVTDANGCTVTPSITITEPTVLTATASATAILCNGGNATVTVVGVGGTAPYAGEGSFSVTAGTYSYTVTDANGCTVTTSITITEPTVLTATSTSTAILCNGGNATVTVVGAGGTAPYVGEGSFTVTAGTYSYTVTDANGCTTTTSITITEPMAIWSIATPTHVTCFLGTDGNIDLNPVGGTPGYTFDWNNGQYTTEDLSGIVAGVYSVLITDANGCSYTDMVTVLEPAQLIATVTAINNPSGCGATNGSIDITVSGGTIGYSYLWSNAATTEDLNAVGAGAYSCVVTDTNGCTANVSGSLNDPNAPTVTLALTVDTLCSTDAAITLAGESPVGGTFSGPGVTGNSFDPTVAGVGVHMITYTYIDINGCSGSTTDSIYVDVCTSTEVWNLKSEVSIYPNPNNGTFTVLAETNSVLRIYDVTGNLIYNTKTTNVRTEINLSEFANGVYVLKAETGENVNTQKIILNK